MQAAGIGSGHQLFVEAIMSRMPALSDFTAAATPFALVSDTSDAVEPTRTRAYLGRRLLAWFGRVADRVAEGFRARRDLRRLHRYAAFDARLFSDIGIGRGEEPARRPDRR
jgi:hypothetical protein